MRKPDLFKPDFGLESLGIKTNKTVYWNLSTPALYEEALKREEGNIVAGGPICVETGKHTGRSPEDRFFVETNDVKDNIWWSKGNKAISEENFEKLYAKALKYAEDKELFVRDAYVGADEQSRMNIRLISTMAWQNLFVKNMFIEPAKEELKGFKPQFTVFCLPKMQANPADDGTRSETAVLVNFKKKIVLIAGTEYAGENKKCIFTAMNYFLPLKGILTMHCSANVGKDGDSALFFGLSGTGKTTLSADITRGLIGDDEHGWDDRGIFNFEGGCYAKVIKLSEEAEPQIYSTTQRFGTVLENVVFDKNTGALDLDSDALTENTRACYPLNFIDNAVESKKGPHPKNIIFLTADAFGVMPPISKLSPEQAVYHFISGYTARVAGTEKGVKEPQSTFSTCFGGPFMPLHPSKYADLLMKKIKEHKADCWLVNTGWTGGPYGVGSRISIKYTRALLNSALSGKLAKVKFNTDPVFGFQVPEECEGIPSEILTPSNLWKDKEDYNKKYKALARSFVDNFKKFEDGVSKEILAAAPKVN
ncbi:Phosphoenolpyruvate carboxykinase (ATP) [Elusimicrobium minutum Pei191]|uniref:Phosphoenolpyruvate carboxykinase (ATP) n=1 Tax=Elusimicrobium minutum (strain Pei191) TaxID=445932 RepID=B2KCQ7_ELUMP|nr:phosphoenolpyruvate carboxykinase [Elusimicrobium minutum]ACC98303.1 Phosphoenolpyruvate carboxykinase (ATP) [Elusimicrobium minutum Pei191]